MNKKDSTKGQGVLGKYFRSIKSSIFTGIVIAIPSFATLYLFFKLFSFIDSLFPNLINSIFPNLPFPIFPGLGLFTFLLIASLIGFAARNYVGKKVIKLSNRLFSKIPLLNKVYLGIQQVVNSIVSDKKKIFERPVLVEYPKSGSYCIGFITSTPKGEIYNKLRSEVYSIFVPTTPNPTSGFLIYMPISTVIELDMTVENALKVVMSAGVVNVDELPVKENEDLFDELGKSDI